MKLEQIPNALSAFRLLLILPFLIFLYYHKYVYAFYAYLIAGVSDGLDGWLARHFSWQSKIGSFIDPLADKLLMAASFISLALIGRLPWWLVLLVFLRDLTICLGVLSWYFFIQKRIRFSPIFLSKINTFLQLMLVSLCLFELAFFDLPSYYRDILIYLTAITTTITYISYVAVWSSRAYLTTKVSK